jgi:hypothetical protein
MSNCVTIDLAHYKKAGVYIFSQAFLYTRARHSNISEFKYLFWCWHIYFGMYHSEVTSSTL